MGSRSTSGTYELWFERLIGAKREVVFGMFTEPGGQVALYRQNEPGWIVRSECAGAWAPSQPAGRSTAAPLARIGRLRPLARLGSAWISAVARHSRMSWLSGA
jgi:hypothetical protein